MSPTPRPMMMTTLMMMVMIMITMIDDNDDDDGIWPNGNTGNKIWSTDSNVVILRSGTTN